MSLSQSWTVISPLDEYIFDHEGTADVSGADFTIGTARGRAFGGDRGVSYIRRNLRDGSRFEEMTELSDINGNFATIARRVQIGMNFSGGIGAFDGDLEKHKTNFDSGSQVSICSAPTESLRSAGASGVRRQTGSSVLRQ